MKTGKSTKNYGTSEYGSKISFSKISAELTSDLISFSHLFSSTFIKNATTIGAKTYNVLMKPSFHPKKLKGHQNTEQKQ